MHNTILAPEAGSQNSLDAKGFRSGLLWPADSPAGGGALRQLGPSMEPIIPPRDLRHAESRGSGGWRGSGDVEGGGGGGQSGAAFRVVIVSGGEAEGNIEHRGSGECKSGASEAVPRGARSPLSDFQR